jgi:hypothetical protein
MGGVGGAGGVSGAGWDDPGVAAEPGASEAPQEATGVRGGQPGRPVYGAAGVVGADPADGERRPVDPAFYGGVLAEMDNADWQGLGIDPERYVGDRLDRERLIGPLLNDPDAKLVLHRHSRRIGQVASIDGSRTSPAFPRRPKDFPGRAYLSKDDGLFHMVGIAGEDWFRQTLYMLAAEGVPADKIMVEETFRPQEIVAEELGQTLREHDFDSVTVGTMGELTRAVERVLRERLQPEHTAATIRKMEGFLADRSGNARADARPRWQARLERLREVRGAGGTPMEQLETIRRDPALKGPLAEWIRKADDGTHWRDLPMATRTIRRRTLAHRILEVDGKKHLLVHIGGAHGDMAYHTVQHVLENEPALAQANVYGSAGSFTDAIPPDTFILPSTTIRSLEEDRAPVPVRNGAGLAGAVATEHSNVSTLMREHAAGLDRLMALPAETVDIESYHVARAAAEAGRPIDLRAILRVSDVATSSHLGAHRDDRAGTSDYNARREGEERVVVALGLVNGPATTTPAGVP